MRSALQRHNRLLSAAVEQHRGWVVKTAGDAFCATFDHAADAIGAACAISACTGCAACRTRSTCSGSSIPA
jgi:class 3 adenylate cyclase